MLYLLLELTVDTGAWLIASQRRSRLKRQSNGGRERIELAEAEA
jgi:hypothetical protein